MDVLSTLTATARDWDGYYHTAALRSRPRQRQHTLHNFFHGAFGGSF